jgi:hypothetical protein
MTTIPLLNWMLSSTLLLGVLWLPYRFALRSERCFGFNRAYLLLAPWLAAGLPWLALSLPRQLLGWLPSWLAAGSIASQGTATWLPTVLATAQPVSVTSAVLQWHSPGWWLGLGYTIGVAFGLLRLGIRLLRLWRRTRQLPRQAQTGYVLVHTGGQLPTSSFAHWVFWNETNDWPAAEAAQVLAHELAHVRQHHTADLLLTDLLQAVLWFNPFVYLLACGQKLNHEFLADAEATARASSSASSGYAALLARHAARCLGGPSLFTSPALLHSFTHSPLLTRIAMLKNPLPVRRWKQALILPTVAAAVLIAGCERQSATPATEKAAAAPSAQELPPPAPGPAANPVESAEQMPQYPGDIPQLMQDINAAIVYPAAALKQKVAGRLFLGFVVGVDGRIYDVTLKNALAPAQYSLNMAGDSRQTTVSVKFTPAQEEAARALEAEALRALQSLDKTWIPGRDKGHPVPVSFTVPVQFTL